MQGFVAKVNLKKVLKRIRQKKTVANLNNLNPSFATDNKLFLKTVKPFFSNNGCYGSQIKLVENNKFLQDAKKLNENALSTVNIDKNIFIMNRTSDDLPMLIEKAIEKYSLRPSNLLIQKHFVSSHSFSFKTFGISNIEKEIININPKKTTTINSIPHKIFKNLSKFSASVLYKLFNKWIENNQFS